MIKSPLPSNPSNSLYQGLAEDLKAQIREGVLAPGDRLPSVRNCASQRGISVSTVLQAYGLLEDRGWIQARPKSGYFVAPPRVSVESITDSFREPEMLQHPLRRVEVKALDLNALMTPEPASAVDPGFGAAVPDASLLPAERLSKLQARAIREHAMDLARYPEEAMYPGLASILARRTAAYPVASRPDDFVVTAGCIEGLNLALRTLARPGDTVAVESPAYFGMLEILDSLKINVVPVCTSPQTGMCLCALEEALENYTLKAVIVTANCQNPLGYVMPDDKKQELLALVDDYGVPLIEDDLNAELSFEQERPLPIKAFDRQGSVIYLSSFSKTLSPGMRIGWALPGRYREQFLSLKGINTMGTPVSSQAAIASFLSQGGYDRHLRHVRSVYQEKANQLREALMRVLPPETCINMPKGGLVLWVEFPEQVDARQLSQDLLDQGIRIPPGDMFSPAGHYRNCLRIAYGPMSPILMPDAVRTLGSLVRKQLESAA